MEHRAQPPQIPAHTRAFELAQQKHSLYLADRKQTQLRSLIRGLLVIAAVILIFSLTRAGLDRAFPPNWWRP